MDGDRAVLGNRCQFIVVHMSFAGSKDIAVVMIYVFIVAAHMAIGDFHSGAAVHRGHLAAAIDGVEDDEALRCAGIVYAEVGGNRWVHQHFGV